MSSNNAILRKADVAVADLIADGGYLNDEQANAFIRKLIEQPTILQNARRVVMNSPQRQINKIGFGSRILRAAASGTALAAGDRVKPDFGQIKLSTNEVIAEVHIPYDVIEDNIERGGIGENVAAGPGGIGGGIKDTIMTLIAERAVLDLEELALLGDTGSGDAFLALVDGWLLQSSVNTVDGTDVGVNKSLFKAGLQAMPSQYLRNRAALRHFLSVDNEIEYRDYLGSRNTGLGDNTITGNNPVFGFGVRVDPVPLMPETNGLMTDPLNLVWGIQRQIQMEADKDIQAREYIIVLTARVDFKVEEPDAIVQYQNVGATTP